MITQLIALREIVALLNTMPLLTGEQILILLRALSLKVNAQKYYQI